MVLFLHFFLELVRPSCSPSNICFSSSSRTTICSPTQTEAETFGHLIENWSIFWGSYSTCLFLIHILSCNSYGTTEVLFTRAFRSARKLYSAPFSFPSASVFSVYGILMIKYIFVMVLKSFKSTVGRFSAERMSSFFPVSQIISSLLLSFRFWLFCCYIQNNPRRIHLYLLF